MLRLPKSAQRGRRVCVGLLAAGTLAVWGCGCGKESPESDSGMSAEVERDVGQRRLHVAPLSLMRGRPEPLSGSLAEEVARFGGIPSLAQRLPLPTQRAWAFPGRGSLCLAAITAASPSIACTRLKRVLKGGMFIASVPAKGVGVSPIRSVVGLVPNGVSRVRILASGAHPRTVPVEENVFALRDEGRAVPESIEFVRSR
jgi:hypothetical protein